MVSNIKMLEMFNDRKMEALFKALQDNAKEEAQKAAGIKTSDAKIIKGITGIKSPVSMFKYAHPFTYQGKTYYGFLDGYRIVASEDHFNYDIADYSNRYDVAKLFEIVGKNKIKVDPVDIKAFSKLNKTSDKPYIIQIGNKYVAFNAKYMSDALEFCGANEFSYIGNFRYSNCEKTPLYIEGNGRIAIVLPINVIDVEHKEINQVA